MSVLDLRADPIDLTAALIDIPSVSGTEGRIADEVEHALRQQTGYEVVRNGNAVLARTHLGRPTRVLLAGHLDTVPIADNVPSWRDADHIYGCGASDMKSGDAVFLHLAAAVAEPASDVTLVLYDCEEIDAAANGLGRIEREQPDWLHADVAILGEPSGGYIEAGCQGTLRAVISTAGTRVHSARSWLGDNAIHKLGAVLDRLARYQGRVVEIDGCSYREGLSAVRVEGGVAGNVIPDAASVTVNFRFAPDRRPDAALDHVRDVFDGLDVTLEQTDAAAGATPPTGWSGPSTAGPTWRVSQHWAFPRSTTGRAIPTWLTAVMNGCRSSRSRRWPRRCAATWQDPDRRVPAHRSARPVGRRLPPRRRIPRRPGARRPRREPGRHAPPARGRAPAPSR